MCPELIPQPLLAMPDETPVCYCGQVSKGAILAALAAGCRSVKDLREMTGCCPDTRDCRKNHLQKRCCLPDIQILLAQALERQTATEVPAPQAAGGAAHTRLCCNRRSDERGSDGHRD